MYLLDSNIVIWFLRQRPEIVRDIRRLRSEGSLGISVLTRFEVLSGMRSAESEMTMTFIESLETFPVTTRIADTAGTFWRRYRRRGRTLNRIDTLIAATAVVEDQTLVTLNLRDYPMPEVRLYGRG